MALLINVLVSGWFVAEMIDELVSVDVMFAPVDVTHAYDQVPILWCLRQPLPLVVVHTQDYAVILKAKEVSILVILHIVEGPDFSDVVRSVIHVLAFLPCEFRPVAVVLASCDPAEILKCVVCPIAVDMVNLLQVFRVWNEVLG